MNWDQIPKSLRERLIKEHPDDFNAAGIVDRLETAQPKPNLGSDGEDPQLEGVPDGFRYRVTLIVVNRRPMDQHDNLRAACKPLVDIITETLGFKSDDDPRLEWRYAQTASRRGDRANRED